MVQFRKPFVITRKIPGAYINGIYHEGMENTFIINASVQPVRGDQMELLPEGRRSSQAIRIYTDTLLETVDGENPDLIAAFGSLFEIISVEHWQSDVI